MVKFPQAIAPIVHDKDFASSFYTKVLSYQNSSNYTTNFIMAISNNLNYFRTSSNYFAVFNPKYFNKMTYLINHIVVMLHYISLALTYQVVIPTP
jgi:hypothetical protein